MGPNGCGKTTLLNLIAGDLRPDSGSIVLDKQDLLQLPPHRRSRVIGRVHQESYKALAAELTVGEVVAIAHQRTHILSFGLPASRLAINAVARLSAAVEDFLIETKRLTAETLSGGQRQLLALAVAVLGAPKLLLLDEHRASLDEQHKTIADELIQKFLDTHCAAAAVATHDKEWAAVHASRIVQFEDGRLGLPRRPATRR